MNQFNIRNRADLLYKQALVADMMIEREIANAKSYDEVVAIVSKYFKDFYTEAGKPLLRRRYPTTGNLPIAEDYNNNCLEIDTDLVILYEEHGYLATLLSDYFNYRQTEKSRITGRISQLTGLCSDLALLANVDNPNCIYIKDTFTTTSNIDTELTEQQVRAYIATSEGVVTLARNSSINRSVGAGISIVQGNGEAGNFHVAMNDSGSVRYVSDSGAHNDPAAILDGAPNTWFEFQSVNFNDDKKKEFRYNINWAQGAKTNDMLRLRVVIDLKEVYDINWITINPYTPPKSNGKVVVHSIRTSDDGLQYKPLYNGALVLNAELNQVPQTYRKDDIVVDDYIPSKFAGQGVWSFETRPARYVEVVLDQPEAYSDVIGHTYYERVVTKGSSETRVRIPENEAPQAAVSGPTGRYTINNNEYVNKSIEIVDGWRYCVGVRDICVYSYKFKSKSEIITKTFSTTRPIKNVLLYVNEKIPPTFLTDIKNANNWITYFISLDGHKWYPISPMHRRPVGDETTSLQNGSFPPKIYEINPRSIPLTRQTEIYKGYITSDKSPTTIKLRAILTRPDSSETLTPLIEDYSLKIYFEEQGDIGEYQAT